MLFSEVMDFIDSLLIGMVFGTSEHSFLMNEMEIKTLIINLLKKSGASACT